MNCRISSEAGTTRFPAENLMKSTKIVFPDGKLAVLGDIPAVGTKFKTATETGPQGGTPLVREPNGGTICFGFETTVP
ncbi:MAG: hypothetical protein JXR25_15950 [Pontiellaceae bacterium]|nr:hypothetical protein [Pontiellaceae bacterium]MBN2786313.1 hypothetical protein [Pontiellaceae bacterium]